ncbi:MAG TPA: PAS domain S-box protein, partial [bacterium]|nr:PAS domain S-box protein [bacterium]
MAKRTAPDGFLHHGKGQARLTILVFLLVLGASWGASRVVQHKEDQHTVEAVQRRIDGVTARIHEQVRTFERAMLGCLGLFAASQSVEAAEWQTFVASQRLDKYYPGVLGLNYVTWQPADSTPGTTTGAAVVAYVAPEGVNRPVQGLDLARIPGRWEALERARDTGTFALTAGQPLPQLAERENAVVLYLPVYGNGSMPPPTVQERRQALTGWVAAPLEIDRFLQAAHSEYDQDFGLQVDLLNRPGGSSTLYGAKFMPGRQTFTRDLNWAGQDLRLHFQPIGTIPVAERPALMVLGVGLLTGTFLALLVWTLASTGQRAERLATAMTAAVQEEQARFRTLSQSAPVGIWQCNAAGAVTYVNPRLLELLGLPETPGAGASITALLFPPGDAPLHRRWREAMEAGASFVAHWRIPIQGQERWFQLKAEPLLEEHGAPSGHVGTLEDITGRPSAMAALEESERRFRALCADAPVGIYETDAAGGLTYANGRLCELLSLEPDQVLGLGWWIAVHPEDREWLETARHESLHQQEPFQLEVRLLHADGHQSWAVVKQTPVRNSLGEFQGFLGTISDITELKRNNEELERFALEVRTARDQAEAATRAKSLFIANMSHELRTPLSAILSYSELLRREAEQAGQSGTAQDLERIHGAGRHLLTLIDGILDLSKLEAGRLQLHLEEYNPALLISEVAETCRPMAVAAGLTLTCQCGDLGMGRADTTRLRQVLFNLLSNACKFTASGAVVVRARRITHRHGDRIEIEVQDTGIGMDSNQLARIFHDFVQVDPSPSRRYDGAGLGLAISRRFCHMMGGTIRVESTPGEGSTFTVEIPATCEPSPEVLAAPVPMPALHAIAERVTAESAGRPHEPLILVIDDDPNIRDLMNRLLAREGYRIVVAPNGETGLKLARALKPCAITLDVMMPGMDG